jgi:hypothetical protein
MTKLAEKQKAGRPTKYGEKMIEYRVRLTESQHKRAKEIGGGELSGGVRKAIEAYEESDSAKDNQKAG